MGEPPPLGTTDYTYNLPEELIAQTPIEPRDHSRLLVLDRRTGAMDHRRFFDLPELLHSNDLLVFNDSRVIPARLRGRKVATQGGVEVLLLRRLEPGLWQALVKPGGRIPPGTQVEFKGGGNSYLARVLERQEDGTRSVWFEDEAAIHACGQAPLPPYIHQPLANAERYQTVYAREEGSAAAPTAGLHFTPELLKRLDDAGRRHAFVTLHVGLHTFRPVVDDDPRRHYVSREFAVLTEETAQCINAARAGGGRLVCVGTTTARVLETAARQRVSRNEAGTLEPFTGWTDLFIRSGHPFQAVDALITNFHLPRSSLLMLVSAFAGKDLVQKAYANAICKRYRFYSFGDAMLIV